MAHKTRYWRQLRRFNRIHEALVVLTAVSTYSAVVHSEDYFDPDSIEKHGTQTNNIDVSSLRYPGGQIAGRYLTEIYLNGAFVAEQTVNFKQRGDALAPEITKQELIKWGVEKQATPQFMRLKLGILTGKPGNYLPGAQFSYNFLQQRLDLSIPQQYIQHHPQGEVSPAEWSNGLNTAFLSYAYSGSNAWSDYRSGNEQSSYLNLRSGINAGAWRLRNYSTWSHSRQNDRWNSVNTYLQRDIKSRKAQFVVGDSYTPSDVFDSFAFRGVQLYSDDNMQPESLRGFAPVVKGIAQSNARVTIHQDGNIIYQAFVPPGPFTINDLYPTSSSGDLLVSIREANGTVRQFTQAFSAVPVMQREGRFKYSFTAGKYRVASDDNTSQREPGFTQFTGIYGLSGATTLYGGTIVSGDYLAGSLGIGKGLGNLGSVSLDSTWAQTQFSDEEKTGASFRFQYAKDFTYSGTTFTVAGYRYSTAGYFDFNEANGYYDNRFALQRIQSDELDDAEQEAEKNAYMDWRSRHNKRSKAQLNINQGMGDYGSLYFSVYQQQYWGVSGKENNASLGYNISKNAINYSLNFTWSQSPYYEQTDRVISLAVQIPFDRFVPKSWMNLAASQAAHGLSTASAGLSGTALADNNLSYNIQQGYSGSGTGVTGNASADYKVRFGEYQAGYNYTQNSRQLNYGVMGGITLHPYGVTLSQPPGDTFALIRADRAGAVKVENNVGVYTDDKGYAVVPYVTPYRRNAVTLDTSSLNKNIDIITDTRSVIPDQGAVVLAQFPTEYGQKIMLQLHSAQPIPFGARASVPSEHRISSGIVDDRQRVYLSGVPAKGTVTVSWQGGHCYAAYDARESNALVTLLTARCQ